MRITLLSFLFLIASLVVKAQCPVPPCPCVDSSRIDIYYHCTEDYNPVCGCDGKTYRNDCAALYWGGLINAPYPFQSGICGNFDIDFVPNPIVPGSALNDHGTLSIYTNVNPVSVLIQIIDVFGRQWYIQQVTISPSPVVPIYQTDIYFTGFQQGIYYLFVTINGETQKKKILKANLI